MGCGGSTQQAKQPNSKKDDKILGNDVPDFYVVEDTKLNQSKTQHEEDDDNKERATAAPSANANGEQRSSIISGVEKVEKKRVVKKGVKKVRGGEDINDFINENIGKIEKAMTKQDEDLILLSLRNHYVFYALTDEELEFIVKKMFYCENSDEYVFKQEDKASSYFIIQTGSVEIVINNETKRSLTVGESFGELALLYNAPRSASIKCKGKCKFWAIDRNSFKKTIGTPTITGAARAGVVFGRGSGFSTFK